MDLFIFWNKLLFALKSWMLYIVLSFENKIFWFQNNCHLDVFYALVLCYGLTSLNLLCSIMTPFAEQSWWSTEVFACYCECCGSETRLLSRSLRLSHLGCCTNASKCMCFDLPVLVLIKCWLLPQMQIHFSSFWWKVSPRWNIFS